MISVEISLKLVVILSSVVIGIGASHSILISSSYVFAQEYANPLVYHLSSDEPWRATVAISDATTLLKLGHNVTLLLSVEGCTNRSHATSSLSWTRYANWKRNELYCRWWKSHYL